MQTKARLTFLVAWCHWSMTRHQQSQNAARQQVHTTEAYQCMLNTHQTSLRADWVGECPAGGECGEGLGDRGCKTGPRNHCCTAISSCSAHQNRHLQHQKQQTMLKHIHCSGDHGRWLQISTENQNLLTKSYNCMPCSPIIVTMCQLYAL